MPSSMTGFASEEILVEPHRLVWEVRSVNHRYLDISLRLPDELRALEPRCRALVGETLRRGKVDCTLRLTAVKPTSTAVSFQEAFFEVPRPVFDHGIVRSR